MYGDTDSIMIHTGTKDLNAARQLGASVKREVNKRYRLLEIELDAVFKTMLLLKKKKYAAIKLEPTAEAGVAEVLEAKGLDIVRRDWCPLSKECGQYVLQQVLSGEAGAGGWAQVAGPGLGREGKKKGQMLLVEGLLQAACAAPLVLQLRTHYCAEAPCLASTPAAACNVCCAMLCFRDNIT